ncbi:MAG: flagellar export chaperone FliS [Chloroflexi bacterium]|nr:flagellar export chaperone FliS [Chloroflexota bacterium]
MYPTDGYQQYKTMQTQTADRGELVVMLYQGAIKFLGRASAALEAGQPEEAHVNLVRGQDVIAELMGSLNPDGGEIAQNLFTLYEYMHYRLVQANIQKDPRLVAEVTQLLRELLPSWQQAARAARAERSEERNAGAARLSFASA